MFCVVSVHKCQCTKFCIFSSLVVIFLLNKFYATVSATEMHEKPNRKICNLH